MYDKTSQNNKKELVIETNQNKGGNVILSGLYCTAHRDTKAKHTQP